MLAPEQMSCLERAAVHLANLPSGRRYASRDHATCALDYVIWLQYRPDTANPGCKVLYMPPQLLNLTSRMTLHQITFTNNYYTLFPHRLTLNRVDLTTVDFTSGMHCISMLPLHKTISHFVLLSYSNSKLHKSGTCFP